MDADSATHTLSFEMSIWFGYANNTTILTWRLNVIWHGCSFSNTKETYAHMPSDCSFQSYQLFIRCYQLFHQLLSALVERFLASSAISFANFALQIHLVIALQNIFVVVTLRQILRKQKNYSSVCVKWNSLVTSAVRRVWELCAAGSEEFEHRSMHVVQHVLLHCGLSHCWN